MDKDACIEDQENGDKMAPTVKSSVLTSAYRYTKEQLLEIKELPGSNERPECLSLKYDSDGVWDPEKWHASLYSECDSSADDRPSLKRRIADPRERLKDDDLEVVLSPQRRSFGGGCHVAPATLTRRPVSPLENKENESLRLVGTRRIGSGRIVATRGFERDVRVDKERTRERESDFKDKRFRRDFGDKRVFSERRRNDSYPEEEPEWFSGGPTSQSETIELIGFDKALEDEKKKPKRSRKRTESTREVECNGGLPEELQVVQETGADQEVPHSDVLPEQTAGDFDFNEFFNLEKTMPGLASLQQATDPAILSPLPETQLPVTQPKNIFQELLGVQSAPRAGSPLLSGLLASSDAAPGLVHHRGASPPLFPHRAPIPEFYTGCLPPAAAFPGAPGQIMGEPIPDLHRAISPGPTPQQLRALSMGVDQADLDALMFQQDLAVQARHPYQVYNKHGHDKAFRNRQPRMIRSPGPHLPGRSSPVSAVTMISPSFTPTSVIKKMYESKDKPKDEPTSQSASKDDAANSQEDSPSPSSLLDGVDGGRPQAGGVKACSTPISSQNRPSKEADRTRSGSSAGNQSPAMLSPGSSTFPRPIYPVPLLSHVSLVRPAPPQLHPSVVQRMITQGIQPQQLGPALLQTGLFPQAVELSQLQGLPPALLAQPLYPLPTAGHPLIPPRAAGTHMPLVMPQQRPNLHSLSTVPSLSQSHSTQRTSHSQRRGGSPPLGLAKWFGSDVLQQPLPSMPSAKVISVDELEFRQ